MGDGARSCQQPRGGNCNLGAQLAVYAHLDFQLALLSVEDDRLILFQFGGDRALGVDQGLFASVFGGYCAQIGLADFDVVAKDFVEADFEVLDTSALTLGLF